ncbi:uncharacterized protein LOC115452152 [Manduca sexta]|uniref:uncharacterized protein LOC115452152 n=1 Tax=Manduca sexta TaxID=7130 RepID=UPI00188EC14A|nr:uncharacterized protein LOC115452152 [Manduca sexta]
MLCTVAFLAMFALVQGRAVNISNTWVLPEEGFPVFYRYFRDRISWYEADAVCQFHHANLVTVDTTAQYDAVRAYLKELDISSAVWVGLIRSNPDGDFTWTDYRGLSGDGYWSSAPDGGAAPLCAAADPAADYRWEARACGGPTVASFICELPVPQWALGNEGCMVRALPALTILYLPESAAVQLTADCGLAGVKRVQCTGNVKREELLRDLSCSQDEDSSTTPNLLSTSTNWPVTTDAIFTDEDSNKEGSTEETITTEHEDDINQPNVMTKTSTSPEIATFYNLPMKLADRNKFNRVILEKNINLNINPNNSQSNYIPKIASEDNMLSSSELDKLEDEKHMQHKMLHEEIARLGNLDNIFTQPTDHFVPPLVMAKAKISDDMTVLSLAEKHAQQLAEQQFIKHSSQKESGLENADFLKLTTNGLNREFSLELLTTSTASAIFKDNEKKDINKHTVPKKYHDKYNELKTKSLKAMDLKLATSHKITETSTQTQSTIKAHETSTTIVSTLQEDKEKQADERPSIDLTVIIKDDEEKEDEKTFYANFTGDVPKLENFRNNTLIYSNDKDSTTSEKPNPTQSAVTESLPVNTTDIQNITLNHETVKITIITDEKSTVTPTVFEIATMVPIFHNDTNNMVTAVDRSTLKVNNTGDEIDKPLQKISTIVDSELHKDIFDTAQSTDLSSTTVNANYSSYHVVPELKQSTSNQSELTSPTIPPLISTTAVYNVNEIANVSHDGIIPDVIYSTKDAVYEINVADDHDFKNNTTDTDGIDDFQSPLLSGANEPIARPTRSRRPQTPNRNKFNPFRILG